MAVLRSGNANEPPAKSQQQNSNSSVSQIQPTTPAKLNELLCSSLLSPVTLKQTGLPGSSSSNPGQRRSLRLASKSISIDEEITMATKEKRKLSLKNRGATVRVSEAEEKDLRETVSGEGTDGMDTAAEDLEIDKVNERVRSTLNLNAKRRLICTDSAFAENGGWSMEPSSVVRKSTRIAKLCSTVELDVEGGIDEDGESDRKPKSGVDKGKAISTTGNVGLVDKGKTKFDLNVEPSGDNDQAEFPSDIRMKENSPHLVRRKKTRREVFKEVAKSLASEYAHFSYQQGENSLPLRESSVQRSENVDDGIGPEEWPGPFSVAMQLIKKRDIALAARRSQQCASGESVASLVDWVPSRDSAYFEPHRRCPSLQELSLSVLCKNADKICSLEGIPDILRNKVSQMLYGSKMTPHVLGLLISGSPSEIRLKGCSFVSEEQLGGFFARCDTSNLEVLQLDLCGRSMSDIFLHTTLATLLDSLPRLTTLSLRGAYRLSDIGLNKLHLSASALRYIDLSECSLLTSDGINTLAENSQYKIRCLYVDNCQNINAMEILPALKKLNDLEVLSVAGLETVSDEFVGELVSVCGPNLKELTFTDCWKLTDSSIQFIGEKCGGLRSLDLGRLHKLTDYAISHLANGCRSIQSFNLCRCSLSDEAVASFLEASGGSLTKFSLNGVKEVAHHTAIALASRCAEKLLNLDLSFCRKLTDEMLGLIVDKCSTLRELKLFGCTPVTNKFFEGHSNPQVQILGMPTGDFLQGLLVPGSM